MTHHERTWNADHTRDFIDGYLKRAKYVDGTSKTPSISSKECKDNSGSLSRLIMAVFNDWH